jgi:hypothetical protein
MKLKKIVASALLAATLTVGGAGVASAESDTTPPTRPTQEQLCNRARIVWQRVQHLGERARAHQEKLTALRDEAIAEGNTDLAAKIDARLARLQERHDRVAARLQALHEKGQGRCAAVLTPAPESPAAPAPDASAS